MKIVMLTPALMLENNRKANCSAMEYGKEHYPVDEFIVNDQEFMPQDYRPGFTYIGNHKERQGFVKGRNQLLEYFYNSDADYAIWMDANGKVSQTALNDFVTIIKALREEKITVDVIYSTLGLVINSYRIKVKQMSDYFDNVYLINFKRGCDWMHGMIMKNFKKYYDQTPYIDERCDPKKGTSEDVYFARLLRKLYDVRLAPTLCIYKPKNKTSTWVADKKGYFYPKVDYATIEGYIKENKLCRTKPAIKLTSRTYIIPREEQYKSLLKPYRPRRKKNKGGLI